MPAGRELPRRHRKGSRGKLAAALAYQLKHAPFAIQIINDHIKRGESIPTPFDKPPGASAYHQIYVSAFHELSDEREIGSDPAEVRRITRRQVKDWLEWYRLDGDFDFAEELWIMIVAMDNEFIPFERKRRQVAQRKANKRGSGRRGAKS